MCCSWRLQKHRCLSVSNNVWRIVRSGWCLAGWTDPESWGQLEINCFVKDLYFFRYEFIIFTPWVFFSKKKKKGKGKKKKWENSRAFCWFNAQVQCFIVLMSLHYESGLSVVFGNKASTQSLQISTAFKSFFWTKLDQTAVWTWWSVCLSVNSPSQICYISLWKGHCISQHIYILLLHSYLPCV